MDKKALVFLKYYVELS